MLAGAAHRRDAFGRKAVASGGVGAFESTIRFMHALREHAGLVFQAGMFE
jgi:hypothetical protein